MEKGLGSSSVDSIGFENGHYLVDTRTTGTRTSLLDMIRRKREERPVASENIAPSRPIIIRRGDGEQPNKSRERERETGYKSSVVTPKTAVFRAGPLVVIRVDVPPNMKLMANENL